MSLPRTSRLPVIYVFGHRDLDLESCVSKLSAYLDSDEVYKNAQCITIKHDVVYSHLAGMSSLIPQVFNRLMDITAQTNWSTDYVNDWALQRA
jgi:diphthamide synthase subunit DPH2